MAGAASNENVYLGSNHTFGTTGPSRLYVESAFRSLSTFQARRVAVLRDNDEPMCMSDTVLEVSADSSVELYGYYELDPKSPEYEEQVEAILTELKAEGVDSVLGCSYEDLCIQACHMLPFFLLLLIFYGSSPLIIYRCGATDSLYLQEHRLQPRRYAVHHLRRGGGSS